MKTLNTICLILATICCSAQGWYPIGNGTGHYTFPRIDSLSVTTSSVLSIDSITGDTMIYTSTVGIPDSSSNVVSLPDTTYQKLDGPHPSTRAVNYAIGDTIFVACDVPGTDDAEIWKYSISGNNWTLANYLLGVSGGCHALNGFYSIHGSIALCTGTEYGGILEYSSNCGCFESWSPGTINFISGVDSEVKGILIQNNYSIYYYGNFMAVVWSGDTMRNIFVDLTWGPGNPHGLSGPHAPQPSLPIGAMYVHNDTLIIAAGETEGYLVYDDTMATAFMYLDFNLGWQPYGPSNYGYMVKQMITYNGQLYACGYFNSPDLNSSHAQHIVKYNGSSWELPGGGIGDSVDFQTVEHMEVIGDKLYCFGRFINSNTGVQVWNGFRQSSTFVTQVDAPFGISAYPNPFQDHLSISNTKNDITFSIIDITGRVVDSGNVDNVINTDRLKSGIYYIRLTDGTKSEVLKLQKI